MRIVERKELELYRENSLTSFFSLSPHALNGEEEARSLLSGREFQRSALAHCLEEYNRAIGNDKASFKQMEHFRQESSVCVFTGQQLGMFGGPSYTILKAVSCLILARKYQAVPVFWLATEDHDVDEIDHTYLIDSLGNLNKFHLSLPKDGRFVEDLVLNDVHRKVINRFCQMIDRLDLAQLLENETSYARAMAKVMVELFKGTGLVFVEPKILRPFAKEIFKKEISECTAISSVLRNTTDQLVKAGGKPILDVSEETNIFIKMKGCFRCKIYRDKEVYRVGKKTFSEQQLLDLIENEPERFSTNAAARCVLQNFLFPVLVYAAGPGELAYYHQLKDYHAYYGIAMPWVVPRLSLSVVTPVAQDMLEKVKVEAWEEIPTSWATIIPNIEQEFGELANEWLESASRHFGKDLSLESMKRFIHFQTKKIERKAVFSRLRKHGIAPHSLHYLRNVFHPHEKMQERVINWLEFETHTDTSIILKLLHQLKEIPRGHIYCYL